MEDKHKFIFHYLKYQEIICKKDQYMQHKSILGYYWKTNQNIIPKAPICMIFHNA